MKLYRCPWCGKPAFTTKHRVFMNLPYGRQGIGGKIHPSCDMCGRDVSLGSNFMFDVYYWGGHLVFLLLFILFGYVIKSDVGAGITVAGWFVYLLVCPFLTAFVTPPIARVSKYSRSHADLQYEIEVNPKINLNIENIYAIRLKKVDPFDVNKDFELVDDFIRDGAPVQIERGDFSYEMGLLQPENYEEKYFEIGTEFDVIDVEGSKISTGVITRYIEKEEKPQS